MYTPPDNFTAQLLQKSLSTTIDGLWGPKSKAAYQKAYTAYHGTKSESNLTTTQSAGLFASRIVQVAFQEIGVKEIGGNNRGARIVDYQRSTWLEPKPWPWCAAFICWIIQEALKGYQVPQDFNRPRTAGAWDFERWAREDGGNTVHLIKPANELAKKGDIIVFTFSHIGLVIKDQTSLTNKLITIEGNTNAQGARDGEGVYRKSRKQSKARSLIRLTF